MNSMVLFKNDLSVPLEFIADVEPKLDRGYWGLVESSAAAGQNEPLFWVSRAAGVTDGVNFMFNAKSQVGGIAVTLSVQLTGTLVGSDIRISVQAGDQSSAWSSDNSVSLDFLANDGKFYHVSGAYVGEGAQFDNVQFSVNPTILPQIKHVIVLMFENRSFDNLLGWLYDGGDDVPACYIPDGTPETFNGLTRLIHRVSA